MSDRAVIRAAESFKRRRLSVLEKLTVLRKFDKAQGNYRERVEKALQAV